MTHRRGRKVYGGGGIEPDQRLEGPIEGFNPRGSGARSLRASCLVPSRSASGGRRYASTADGGIAVSSVPTVVDDEMIAEFRSSSRHRASRPTSSRSRPICRSSRR